MSIAQIEIILLASIVSTACVLPGVFLVLRKVALMSDAISHAILLGIVVVFLLLKDLHSPLLIVGATLAGILTVSLTEIVIESKLIKKDAAIGLIFPVFFSLGVILITQYADNVHIDTDAVLLGEIAFAPFNRFLLNGFDFGPIGIWIMGTILLLNLGLLLTFYKELKLVTFDSPLSASLGFSPQWLHYGLMGVVSITCVGAFDAVGSILVVALMITPPATAYLFCERLSSMIFLSVALGIASSILGYGMAYVLNASISGSIATMTGIFLIFALLFSPRQGLVFAYFKRKHQRVEFSAKMLAVQLYDHEGTASEAIENSVSHLTQHMDWSSTQAKKATRYALSHRYITRDGDLLTLTNLGREFAKSAMVFG